jgi:hypothetical protein
MHQDDLAMVVDLVRQKLRKHREVLVCNEWFVLYVLIDPVLRALGWMTDDPTLVQVEYNVSGDRLRGPSVDYALIENEKPMLFIEVKTLDGNLNKAKKQCEEDIQRCNRGRVSSFIVTDGQRYKRYDSNGQDATKLAEFDIAEGDITNAAQECVNWIGKPAVVTASAVAQRNR